MKTQLTLCLGAMVLLSLPTQAQDTGAQSDARLKRLEDAVRNLQTENAQLKKQVHEQLTQSAPIDVPAALPDSRISLSQPVKELELFGEMRLRYFMNQGEAAGRDGGDLGERYRLRYRFRLGANVKMNDQWTFGVLVETGNVARSANVTLGENLFAKSTPPTLRKDGTVAANINYGDTLFVGRAFLKYTPTDWFLVEGGKIPNPFVFTRMVWDPDLNPEGFAQQFKYTLALGSPTAAAAQGSSKPGGVPDRYTGPMGFQAPPAPQEGMSLDLFANFGQFVYSDIGFTNAFNSGSYPNYTQNPGGSSLWMLGWQAGGRLNFNKTTFVQVAPTLYNYFGTGRLGTFNGDNANVILNANAQPLLVTSNQTGVNDLAVFDVPVELDWRLANVPMRLFGDFAVNVDGSQRAKAAGHSDKGNQNTAYLVGLGVGTAKRKGDLQFNTWWESRGQFSLDQNITDDDIFDGRLNMEGFYADLTYLVTDDISVILTGAHGTRIDQSLGTAGFGALGTPAGFPIQNTNLLYLDVNLRF